MVVAVLQLQLDGTQDNKYTSILCLLEQFATKSL